jgi:phytoene dehydrogenase-like protein
VGKSIIIIGAGLSGLAAGCYGQMNGYKTAIFEMHDIAGGVCTAWKRKGYTIDGAMNWLIGTRPGSPFYKFWEELGAAGDWQVYNHDRYMINEDREGKAFTVYCDAGRFEQYLLELAPEDGDAVREFTQDIRTLANCDISADKPVELFDVSDQTKIMQTMPALELMQKWGAVSIQDFARRLKSPYLREAFANMPAAPMAMLLMVLAWQHSKSAGYVIGGALALVQSIEKRYRQLGGEIHFKSTVAGILVENDKAVGIRLDDGSEYRADYIISACDGRTVIFDMLGGKYIDETLKNMYEHPNLFAPLVYVGLGVKRSFKDVPSSVGGLRFPLDTPVTIAGKPETSMNVLIYNFDPTLAPEGKSVIVVSYATDYDYWHNLRQDLPRYRAEKERLADDIVAGLEQRFPGITEQVEMRDVATPVTWERYTGNWRGAYEGWMFGSFDNVRKTLPGLDNFYMAGQWVNPGGGMPPAVMSGRHTIQFICHADKREFVTA